jgi:hypothetical protein
MTGKGHERKPSDESRMLKRFEAMSEEELSQVLGRLSDTYTPEALQVASAVAIGKGMVLADAAASQRDATTPAQDGPVGVGGLLAVLIGVFLVNGVAMLLLLFLSRWEAGRHPIAFVAWLFNAAIGIMYIIAGTALWRRAPGGAIIARGALWASIVWNIFLFVALLGTGESGWAIWGVAQSAVWLAYLEESRRVALTFPSLAATRENVNS